MECFDTYSTILNSSSASFNLGAIRASAQGTSLNGIGDTNVATVKIQVGGSTSTTCGPDPIAGQVGSPFPSFFVLQDGTNIPDTNATFLPAGSSTSITSNYINNIFTPYPGQTIANDVTIGQSSGILTTGRDGVSLIPTNFTARLASGGGTITIGNLVNSSSSIS